MVFLWCVLTAHFCVDFYCCHSVKQSLIFPSLLEISYAGVLNTNSLSEYSIPFDLLLWRSRISDAAMLELHFLLLHKTVRILK